MTDAAPHGAFDAHTHLDFPEFDRDRAEVCARARGAGVSAWVVAGADPALWPRVRRVAEETHGVAVLGVHPWFVDEHWASRVDELAGSSVSGLGETGLDWLHARAPEERARQLACLRAHLALARERDLPVTVHCVRAHAVLADLLKSDGTPAAGLIVHGWTGPLAGAQQLARLGATISIGPRVTDRRARRCRESAAGLPLDRLVIETDCPDAPLAPGRRGEPADLIAVAATVASLRGIPPAEVIRATSAAARRLWPAAPRGAAK